jgi:MarR family transcriptional regulator for hemolysin
MLHRSTAAGAGAQGQPAMTGHDRTLFAFTNAIQPARRAWHQAVTQALADTGLSTALALMLLLASRLGPRVPQKALAMELGIDPAALVRLLDQAEAAGLLARGDLPGDRRSKAICLLPPGEALAARMEQAVAALRARLLEGVPDEDLAQATRTLRLFEERVQRHLQGGKAGTP